MATTYSNLHEEFQGAIRAGDERLREHIDQQIKQVRDAIAYAEAQIRLAHEASERLERERIKRVEEFSANERLQLDKRVAEDAAHLQEHIEMQVGQIAGAVEIADRQTRLAFEAGEKLEKERIENLASYTKAQIESLDLRLREGDERLTKHIEDQVGQIRAALEAVETQTKVAHQAAQELELTRINEIQATMTALNEAGHKMIEQRIAGVQREFKITFDAAQVAIVKAEESTDKRLAGLNALREELSSRWSQAMPREVAEKQFENISERLHSLEIGSSRIEGTTDQSRRHSERLEKWHLWAAGGVLSFFLALIIFAANLLSGT